MNQILAANSTLAATVGGALIGLSAVLLMSTAGRIAGISGFVSRLLPPYTDNAFSVRAAFILGLIAAPLAYRYATGDGIDVAVSGNVPLLLAAGLLVGFGAVRGGGCTSGHGVCGIARFSPRSIVATLAFMATAIATVFIIRHVIGN